MGEMANTDKVGDRIKALMDIFLPSIGAGMYFHNLWVGVFVFGILGIILERWQPLLGKNKA
jgi:hypothetical protein